MDDTPFGGGAGMVLRVDVVEAALRARYGEDPVALRRAPAGDRAGSRAAGCWTRRWSAELAAEPALTLLCGRYEGFDERILEHFATDRVSIGRYVLAGGELPAMVLCDAVLRKLPGRARATSTRRWRSRSAPRSRAAPSTRTTPARPSTAAGGCPRCCSPATTPDRALAAGAEPPTRRGAAGGAVRRQALSGPLP